MHATDRTTQKPFEIPDALPNSEVKAFVDSLGYSIENVDLIEGDKLWYNTVTEEIRTEPPSKTSRGIHRQKNRVVELLRVSTENSYWESVWRALLCTTVVIGVVVSGPIGSIGLIGYLNQQWKGEIMYPDNIIVCTAFLLFWTVLWCSTVIMYLLVQ